MTKEMNETIFLQNLQKAIQEIILKENILFKNCKFRINPVVEQGKSMQAKDEMMRLNILNPDRVKGRTFTIDEVVSMLTFFSPLVPLWINCKMVRYVDGEIEIQLDCSLRLRKPSLLRNQELGYPPFKAIV
jgi:hypothetical protein